MTMSSRDPSTLAELLALATAMLRMQQDIARLKAEVAEMRRVTEPAKPTTFTEKLTTALELLKLLHQFLSTPFGQTIIAFLLAAGGVVVRSLMGRG